MGPRPRGSGPASPAEIVARNRLLMRELLARPGEAAPRGRRALALVAMAAPVVAAFGAAAVLAPGAVANVAVAAGIGAGVVALLLPCALLVRRRADRALAAAAAPACAALAGAGRALPVRYGLNTASPYATEPAAWDRGPQRAGAVEVTPSALLLRGADGAALDVPLTALLGAVDQPGTWPVQGCVDVHLRSGEAVQLRTPHRRELITQLRAAGIRVPR
ncbi:hypothetical protein DMB38_14300 [Streptomyces sp. WAC 06738]|uniref:hypothetical protein n=1 Tax=Streptomyces sp. WAC 06738 TaxID=2203210 RepID=UPI000F6B7203|nr:hypothetical protein [Streptomyces sp. WAC 06738]AZM46820.1 hypothetical protein DMB38_14300 [Streptomyces sp. WAC 06738]